MPMDTLTSETMTQDRPHEASAGSIQLTARQHIGRYQIDRFLRRTATGWIFACHDPNLKRPVAVKVVDPELPPNLRTRMVRRFKTEVRVLGRLKHPNVVAIYDAGMDGKWPFLAMELCTGPTLAGLMRRKPRMSFVLASRLVGQLARALDYLHENQVVHRNLNPANILLHNNDVKIIDFSLVRDLTGPRNTYPGQVFGTTGFMSPEQARGERPDAASDRYALAALLFTMLTGAPLTEDPEAIVLEPPRITALCPEYPPALDGFFAKALAPNAAARFSSGEALREALEGIDLTGQSPETAGMSKLPSPPMSLAAPLPSPPMEMPAPPLFPGLPEPQGSASVPTSPVSPVFSKALQGSPVHSQRNAVGGKRSEKDGRDARVGAAQSAPAPWPDRRPKAVKIAAKNSNNKSIGEIRRIDAPEWQGQLHANARQALATRSGSYGGVSFRCTDTGERPARRETRTKDSSKYDRLQNTLQELFLLAILAAAAWYYYNFHMG